ncbi:MAG: hypothetical protein JWR32_3353 [Mycobacterium sp.]|jgi:hypothetical protein|nr:hypothetical protein [Mycobacterium sp.]
MLHFAHVDSRLPLLNSDAAGSMRRPWPSGSVSNPWWSTPVAALTSLAQKPSPRVAFGNDRRNGEVAL